MRCLRLSLLAIERALVRSGPHGQVRANDTVAGEFIAYGPPGRAAVLAEAGAYLACRVAEHALWLGEGPLSPLDHPV
ncbi:hypothetical protein [Streptomyces sp. NPDC048710]|uniref:hypothetical protein n=1 Tax=unclassified Streptomyces TaxID=2593676 RepID=UPI00371DD78E